MLSDAVSNAYSTASELARFFRRNRLDLKDLQEEVQNSRSDVQRYLNLGWIGVCEIIAERHQDMDNLMDLWQEFLSFLLVLQYFYLKLEKILALWEKVLYLLLLYLSFSEFPNSLRPPCTTMPWTIWPALLVLWGVCWMFQEGLCSNWGDQGELPKAGSAAGPFEDIGHADPSHVSDYDLVDISFDDFMWDAPYFEVPILEQRLPLWALGSDITSSTAMSLDDSIPTSTTVNPTDTVHLPVVNHGATSGIAATHSFSSDPTMSIIPRVIASHQPEATESGALVSLTSLVQEQPKDSQGRPSRSSKHSQTEKYFCTYPDSIHFQSGSGFKRKDHLDQHLRGRHKQTSVQRLRAKPAVAVALSINNPTTTNNTTEAPSQSKKKRKRGSEEESSGSDLDRFETELAEERRLRRLVEEDNQVLRKKLENYERRMEKYEERLDRMMNLLEEH